MRYIASKNGLVLAPRRHFSHQEMARLAGLNKESLVSAGFLPARYEQTAPWVPYGRSVGLDLASASIEVPETLWVGKFGRGVLFSDNPALLADCETVVQAAWGMSEEGWEGTCAVFSPLHPDVCLTADEIIRD